jgi:amidase
MLAFLAGYDAILCPVQSGPAPLHPVAPPLGGPPPRRPARCNYCLPYSLTGWPCAVVRAGTAPEGLPLGVQIVARPWREDVALALAQQIETALGGWRPPAL